MTVEIISWSISIKVCYAARCQFSVSPSTFNRTPNKKSESALARGTYAEFFRKFHRFGNNKLLWSKPMKVKHKKNITNKLFFSNPGMFYFVNQQQNMGINLLKKVQGELFKRVLKSSISFSAGGLCPLAPLPGRCPGPRGGLGGPLHPQPNLLFSLFNLLFISLMKTL